MTAKKLKVAYLMPSVSRAAGGIFEVERRLAQQMEGMDGVEVEAFGTEDEFTKSDVGAWEPVQVNYFPTYGPSSFGWSPALQRAFCANSADVGHLHVLWMHTSLIMRSWSSRNSKPFLTTLHGMLDTWALQNSRWKKRVSLFAYERSCLNAAGCVQAFSQGELASARQFGLKNPVCIIPNGIDIPLPSTSAAPWDDSHSRGKKSLLFLGRLHPKKGLINLLKAWTKLRNASHPQLCEWQLLIAGWSQSGHELELKELVAANGIESVVRFLGPLYGEAKAAAYSCADAIVLPSLSEGLPMAVLEAWSYRKPVLITPQCNLPEGAASGAAIQAEPDVSSLTQGIASLIEASDSQRQEMGHRGWELVNQKFTWTKVASEMLAVYSWLAGGGMPPNCVQLN